MVPILVPLIGRRVWCSGCLFPTHDYAPTGCHPLAAGHYPDGSPAPRIAAPLTTLVDYYPIVPPRPPAAHPLPPVARSRSPSTNPYRATKLN